MAKDSSTIEFCSFSHKQNVKLVLRENKVIILIGFLFVLNMLN